MKCDKCGLEVPYHNDATIVDAKVYGDPSRVLFHLARHFMPVTDENGNAVCEGSPSRAQYIEGQPRDNRGYPYIKERENAWRSAWAELQSETFSHEFASEVVSQLQETGIAEIVVVSIKPA